MKLQMQWKKWTNLRACKKYNYIRRIYFEDRNLKSWNFKMNWFVPVNRLIIIVYSMSLCHCFVFAASVASSRVTTAPAVTTQAVTSFNESSTNQSRTISKQPVGEYRSTLAYSFHATSISVSRTENDSLKHNSFFVTFRLQSTWP